MIKKFENFANESIVPFMPDLTIDSLIEELDIQKPKIHYKQTELEEREEEKLIQKSGLYNIFWTNVNIDGENISVECKKHCYIPLPIAIASINNYAIGFNRKSIKLYRAMSKIYKEQLNDNEIQNI
jgi:hypothetical protein